MTLEELTPRQRFRELLRSAQEEHPELSAPELADRIAATLPDDDRELVEQFLSSEARNIIAWELGRQIQAVRSGMYVAIDLRNPAAPPISQRSERVRETLYDRIEIWKEWVPSEHRTRPVMDMTRRQLLESATYDMARVATFGYKALVKKKLAQGMPDDDVPAHHIYTAEQIAGFMDEAKREVNHGHLRLSVKALDALPSGTAIPRQGRRRRPSKG